MNESNEPLQTTQEKTSINNFQDIETPSEYTDINKPTSLPKNFNLKYKLKINLHSVFAVIVVILLLVTIVMDFFLIQQNQQLKNNLKSINYKVTTVLPQQINFDCQANAALPQNCR
jgi:hypothetical protein